MDESAKCEKCGASCAETVGGSTVCVDCWSTGLADEDPPSDTGAYDCE